ncbi:NAD/NADP octopine/nopaline dehydrogenase family protein, partial [Vibrio sp. 10N.222.55.E8]
MESERQSIGKALGLQLLPELQAMNALYGMKCESVYEVNRTSETHGKLNSAPNSASNRYITEDAAYLLVPCYELGK